MLDTSMAIHGERLALSAAQEPHALNCGGIDMLEETLGRFEVLRRRIPTLGPVQELDQLRRLLEGISQVHYALQAALFAATEPGQGRQFERILPPDYRGLEVP